MKMILLAMVCALALVGCSTTGHSAKCCSKDGTCTAAKGSCCQDGK